MTNEKQQFQASAEIPFITNIQLNFSDEFVVFNVFSGNRVYRFALTPKHAKRVHLLLERELEKYEQKHGELETQLPQVKDHQQEEGSSIGFK